MPLHTKKNGKYDSDITLTELEKTVVKSVKKHIELMFADDWYITVEFDTVEGEAAETEASPEYRKAIITVDPHQMEDQLEYLDKYIRHEICHILLWNYFSIAEELCYKRTEGALRKLEEQLVYLLEHMPCWERFYKELDNTKK
jgi:hypothetical protein